MVRKLGKLVSEFLLNFEPAIFGFSTVRSGVLLAIIHFLMLHTLAILALWMCDGSFPYYWIICFDIKKNVWLIVYHA